MEATALAPALRAPRVLLRTRSDDALVERFRLGDDAAFTALYRRHRTRVYLVCLGVLSSEEDAKDAEQEVWVAAASSLRTTTPDVLAAWLARIARNVSVDIVRRRRETASDLPDRAGGHDAHTVLEQRAAMQDVLVALRGLPEAQRVALVLRELGGFSYPEIALAVGVEEEAVSGLIARARISLRERRSPSSCETVRAHLAAELDGRRRPAEVRRHLRACNSCRDFRAGVLQDRKDLRALAPAAGGLKLLALVGGALAKGTAVSEGPKLAVFCVAAVCAGAGVQQLEASHPASRGSTKAGSGEATARLMPAAATTPAPTSLPSVITTPAATPAAAKDEPSTASGEEDETAPVDEPASTTTTTTTSEPADRPERRREMSNGDDGRPRGERRGGGDRMEPPSMPRPENGGRRGDGGSRPSPRQTTPPAETSSRQAAPPAVTPPEAAPAEGDAAAAAP